MPLIKSSAACLIVGLIIGQMPLQARGMRLWSYDDLLKASDVVAVIQPLKTENNDDDMGPEWDKPSKCFQGLSTTFKVHCYFAGVQPATEVVVKYFGHIPGTDFPANGPELAEFPLGLQTYEIHWKQKDQKDPGDFEAVSETPYWLAFLKRAADGSFVPVTGQVDAALSFKRLRNGLMP